MGTDAKELEEDKSEIEDVLTHIGVLSRTVDLKRVGKPNDKRARPLKFDVDSVWHKRMMILQSLVKMKSYSQNLFISREPKALGRETENESPNERRNLLLNNYPKEDLRMRNFRLYKKEDGQWIEA